MAREIQANNHHQHHDHHVENVISVFSVLVLRTLVFIFFFDGFDKIQIWNGSTHQDSKNNMSNVCERK